ncbi:MAG: DsbA family protein [Candidatus Woesearchaeota archaeon]
MLCVVAFIVFGIMGIFSLKYRTLAKEALNCTFRRVTLRKCDTGLDKKVKNMFVAKLGRKHPRLGRFLYKYFEVFTWILILLTAWSMYEIGVGTYNYAVYGSCIKPGDSGVCILNIQESLNQYSTIRADYPDEMIYPSPKGPSIGNSESDIIVIMFGCFTCPYTTLAIPKIDELIEEYKDEVLFVFKDFPILNHRYAFETATYAKCALEQNKYFEARTLIYTNPYYHSRPGELAIELNLDLDLFNECINSEETENYVFDVFEEGINAHIRATPTFFINEEIITGSRDSDIDRIRRVIEEELR